MNGMGDMGGAARMRADFDRIFTEPPPAREAAGVALLTLWVGGDPYAIRGSEIGGLLAGRPITKMPGADPAYLGLAGLRGALLPVWDLALALGYPRAPRIPWMVFSSHEPAWALAFERFDAYHRVSKSALVAGPAQGPFSTVSRQGIDIGGTFRTVLDLDQLVKAIQTKHPSNHKGNPS